MSVANITITFTKSTGEVYTTTTDASGAYSKTLPAGIYTLSAGVAQESGFAITFDRAIVTDVDQSGAVVNVDPVPDVDISASIPAVVNVYYDKVVSGLLPPVSQASTQSLDRTVDWRVGKVLTPSMFLYTSNEVTPILEKVKITGLPVSGQLQYGGVIIEDVTELTVVGGTTFSSPLVYYASDLNVLANNDPFYFSVKTVASPTFG